MPKANQIIERAKIKKGATQRSDVEDTAQTMREINAAKAEQKIGSRRDTLRLGNYSASGSIAILALVLIALAYFAYQYLGG